MGLLRFLPKRGETTGFSKSYYEVLFSVFMVALAFFYRRNPLISYPDVLFLFMSLLAANFVFNRVVSERIAVSLWLVDIMLISNISIITIILSRSGGALSYFWVLYLLPIFTAALTGLLAEVAVSCALCVLALWLFSSGPALADAAQLFTFLTKFAVFVFSAFVIYRTVLARRRMEAEVTFKRLQIEKLMADASELDSKAQLEASAAAVGRISAGLLHDIGNVLAIILLSSEIMVQDENPSPGDARRVRKAALMAKSIIEGALAMIRGTRYEFRSASLKDPMENAAALFTGPANSKNVKFSVSLEEGLPEVRMSVPHIQRVFVNAITNSLSFLKPGGAIALRAVREGEAVRVSIEDDGPGFPPEILAAGVKEFGTGRKEKGGTGLGLFNSMEIVEKHGGKLSIRNAQPSGAVVEFTLPVAGLK